MSTAWRPIQTMQPLPQAPGESLMASAGEAFPGGAFPGGALPHPRPRWFTRQVRDDEAIQPYRHVWNVTIAAWLDELAAIVFDRQGTVARGRSWFIVEQAIRFRAETMQGDDVLAAAWIAGVDRVRAALEVRLFRSADGAPLVDARSSWTLVDLTSRTPQRVPPEMRAMLDPAPETTA